MPLSSFLNGYIRNQFSKDWTERRALVVPEAESLNLGKILVRIDGTVLYADLFGSTQLVDTYPATFAAGVYKSYLYSAARIIRIENGKITSYDGDRIMGIFKGPDMETRATRAALKINWVVSKLINPILEEKHGPIYSVAHKIGIDSSELHATRTGIRGSNDLVWIGRAANHAAKLTALAPNYAIRITDAVLVKLDQGLRTLPNGDAIWHADTCPELGGIRVHKTNCAWET